MFAHLLSRVMRRPVRFSHIQSYSLRLSTSSLADAPGLLWAILGAGGILWGVTSAAHYNDGLSLLPLIFTVAGIAVAPAVSYLALTFPVRTFARHATREVGPFFGVKLSGVERILGRASGQVKSSGLAAGSEPVRLLRSAEKAYQASIFAAETLYQEMAELSPKLKRQIKGIYRNYTLYEAETRHQAALPLLPSELRAQVELFVESLTSFEKFEEAFKLSLELEQKPRVVTADISEYLNASASFTQDLEDAALQASVNSSAHAELEDFLDLQLKSSSETYPSRAGQELP